MVGEIIRVVLDEHFVGRRRVTLEWAACPADDHPDDELASCFAVFDNGRLCGATMHDRDHARAVYDHTVETIADRERRAMS